MLTWTIFGQFNSVYVAEYLYYNFVFLFKTEQKYSFFGQLEYKFAYRLSY